MLLRGDKLAYPAFNLCVVPPDFAHGSEGLAVDILMEIFPPDMPDGARPTLENQVGFLVQFGPILFAKPVSEYLPAYDRINESFTL